MLKPKGPNGGPRPGSGRKKGSPNKIRAEEPVDRVKRAISEGLTPLEFLLATMRDESKDLTARLDAAGKAAPYVHRKQPQDVTVGGSLQVPVSITMQVVGPRRE